MRMSPAVPLRNHRSIMAMPAPCCACQRGVTPLRPSTRTPYQLPEFFLVVGSWEWHGGHRHLQECTERPPALLDLIDQQALRRDRIPHGLVVILECLDELVPAFPTADAIPRDG